MNKVLNTVLSLVALLVLGAVTVGIAQLGAAGTTPAPQATAAPASVAATTEISATNTTPLTVKPLPPRAGPNPLVIQGVKWLSDDVSYTSMPLVVWSLDPTTMAPTDTITNYVVSWLPAAGGVNTVSLSVQLTGLACEGIVNSEPSQPPVCFTVAVTHGNTLPTGQYTSTLYISNNTGVESTVSVQVLVGRNIWTLLAIVVSGVIATEIWLQWRRSWRYQRGWKYRRNQWIEWLGSNSDWLQPFQGTDAEQAARSVLRTVQAELRTQVKPVSDWLAQGQAGKLTMSDLAERSATIPALIDPIELVARRYLRPEAAPATEWRTLVEGLTASIRSVIENASASAAADYTPIKTELDKVYVKDNLIETTHPILEKTWHPDNPTTTPPPTDAALLAAWTAAQAMWTKYGTLKTLAGALKSPDPKVPADVANRVSELSLHLDSLSQEVAEKAKTQLEAVNKVNPNTAGQIATQNFLKAAAIDLSALKQMLLRAQHPLQFTSSETPELKNLQKNLTDLNACADKLHVADLADDAASNQLLGSLRKALGSVDAKLADPKTDFGAYWNELLLTYHDQERVIDLGGQIGDLLKYLKGRRGKRPADELRMKQAQAQLRLAYEHLLSGQWLDAEIAIERAQHNIYESKFSGRPTREKSTSLFDAMTTLKLWMIIQKWFKLWKAETIDVFWPKAQRFVGWVGSLLLSLVIAVTIVIAAQEVILKNNVYTWGSNLDLIVAFTWGAVAHRLVQGLQSSLSSDKPATDTAKAAEGK